MSMKTAVIKNLHNFQMVLKTQLLTTYFINCNCMKTYLTHKQTVVCQVLALMQTRFTFMKIWIYSRKSDAWPWNADQMLYATDENFLKNFSMNYYHSCRATFNQIICVAHCLQFSVKSIFEALSISVIFEKIWKSALFLWKSSMDLFYPKKAFVGSADFNQPLRSLIDVKSSWGFALARSRRCLKTESIIKDAD